MVSLGKKDEVRLDFPFGAVNYSLNYVVDVKNSSLAPNKAHLESGDSIDITKKEFDLEKDSSGTLIMKNETVKSFLWHILQETSDVFTASYVRDGTLYDDLHENGLYMKIFHVGVNDGTGKDDVISLFGLDKNNIAYMLFLTKDVANDIFSIDFCNLSESRLESVKDSCLYRCIQVEDVDTIFDPSTESGFVEQLPFWMKNVFGSTKEIEPFVDKYGFIPMWLHTLNGFELHEAPEPKMGDELLSVVEMSIDPGTAKITLTSTETI